MQNQFIVSESQNALVDGPTAAIGYTFGGKEVPPDDQECLAKQVFDPATNNTRYWLKRATSGGDAGKLFNPHSPLFEAGGVNRFHKHLGKGQYEFVKTTKESFDAFLRFLVSGNTLHLRQAERE